MLPSSLARYTGVHASSPARADAADAEAAAERMHSDGRVGGEGALRISKQSLPLLPTAGSFAWKPFGGSDAAAAAAAVDLDNAAKKSAAGGKSKKEASEGAGGGEGKRGDAAPGGAEGAGSDEGDGDKLGLRLSAMFVREALKDFRNQRATMVSWGGGGGAYLD